MLPAIPIPLPPSPTSPKKCSYVATLPQLQANSLPSPRPLPKVHLKPHLEPGFTPMTKVLTPSKKKKDFTEVNVDDCHTPELVVQGFTELLSQIRASFTRMDATTTIFQAELEEANSMLEYVESRHNVVRDTYEWLLNSCATEIQRFVRGFLARMFTNMLRFHTAAIEIQRIVRGRIVRRKYAAKKLQSTIASTILGLRTLRKIKQGNINSLHSGSVLDLIKASLCIQSKWRTAYGKVKFNVGDIQTIQMRQATLRKLFIRTAWNICTMLSILRFWKKATQFSLVSLQPRRKRSVYSNGSALGLQKLVSSVVHFRRSVATIRDREKIHQVQQVIENVAFFCQPPKAWYARHEDVNNEEFPSGELGAEFASTGLSSLLPPAAPSQTKVVMLKDTKDNNGSRTRSLSLPHVASFRRGSFLRKVQEANGVKPLDSIVPTPKADQPVAIEIPSGFNGTTVPKEFNLSATREKKARAHISKEEAKQQKTQFIAKLQHEHARKRQAQLELKRKQDEKSRASEIAYQEEATRQKNERQKRLEENVEKRRQQRARRGRHRFESATHKKQTEERLEQTRSQIASQMQSSQAKELESTLSNDTPVNPSNESCKFVTDAISSAIGLIVHVFSFLTPTTILKTRLLSKAWAIVSTMDRIWRPFCIQRWQMQPRLMRLTRYGVHSYVDLYRHLAQIKQKPSGAYSTQDKLTWGHARHDGVESWLTLGHRSDCKVLRVRSKCYIQLRIIVQNVSASPVLVDLGQIQVHFKNGPIVPVVVENPPTSTDMLPKVLAWNGTAIAPTSSATMSCQLSFFDFAVIGVYVDCDDCEFEADFLERASSIWIPLKRRGDCNDLSRCRCMLIPDHYHHFGLHVPLVDESVIWNRYTQCGRGFMVLTTKDRLTTGNYASDLPTRYLIDDYA